MGIRDFWASLETLATKAWTATDDAWKVLRWIAASTAVLAVFDKSGNIAVLCLGVGLAVFAVGALAALMYRWCLGGLTEKGKNTDGWLAVIIAFGFFLFSIAFAVIVWTAVASLHIQFLQSS